MPRMCFKPVYLFTIFWFVVIFPACTSKDPEGKYVGEVKDWVYEVFEGNLIAGGKACKVELSLSRGPKKWWPNLFLNTPKWIL